MTETTTAGQENRCTREQSKVARAGGRVAHRGVFDRSHVPAAERRRLADGVGALLRERRAAVGFHPGALGRHVQGMTGRALAAEAGLASSTVSRLERGELRPRRGTLRVLAAVLDPDDPEGFTERLAAAAGDSLREDTRQSLRRRRRRTGLVNRRRAVISRRARELDIAASMTVAYALSSAATRAINRGCLDSATEADQEAAAAAFARANAARWAASAQRMEADRLRSLLARRPAPAPAKR